MRTIDFSKIVERAWHEFGNPKQLVSILDVSPNVSTNYVFKLIFEDETELYAKLSYFGQFNHFREDHTIVNTASSLLPAPYQHFLANALMKDGELFTFRLKEGILDAWLVFYEPVSIKQKLPRKLQEKHIRKLGRELASFHKVCTEISPKLPKATKTLSFDIKDTLALLETSERQFEYGEHIGFIREQCQLFLTNMKKFGYNTLPAIPVFVDWNIGNFSIDEEGHFHSRWDYDWFRMSSRVMDFYFFSRVVSTLGDRTVFSYLINPLLEERFLLFLQEYHQVFPLTEQEIHFIKEAYRFFILNYVIKDGRYFFHEIYANKLRKEACELYLPLLDKTFDSRKILQALNL